jgi:hypothetical protein
MLPEEPAALHCFACVGSLAAVYKVNNVDTFNGDSGSSGQLTVAAAANAFEAPWASTLATDPFTVVADQVVFASFTFSIGTINNPPPYTFFLDICQVPSSGPPTAIGGASVVWGTPYIGQPAPFTPVTISKSVTVAAGGSWRLTLCIKRGPQLTNAASNVNANFARWGIWFTDGYVRVG